jgi:hypothetical protein
LRFVYLLVIRSLAAARFAGCGDDGKTSEILLLRHQLASCSASSRRPGSAQS